MPRNLASLIEKRLPADVVETVRKAAALGARRREQVYLVGGVVRDLLLGKASLDLDLVVEGNAISFARDLTETTGGRLLTHRQFNTAKLRFDGWSLDVAAARSETYERPGALPRVRAGSLQDDLLRRDFTVNGMAIRLTGGQFGELVDLYGGARDLRARRIRVLHDRSFTDDATRIWRAIRYEQRLGFQIEPHTLRLMKRDLDMLRTISGDRIRRELELVLEEGQPENALQRAWRLGVLGRLNPALRADAWLRDRFVAARKLAPPALHVHTYWALLAYRLTPWQISDVIAFLRLPRRVSEPMQDAAKLRDRLPELAAPHVSRSQVYAILRPYGQAALLANQIAGKPAAARRAIRLYVEKLRLVAPRLTGNDLLSLGVTQGPHIRELLNRLRDARLDGQIASRRQEEGLVKEWLRKNAQ
jgi:tRNA nucleotidyltransferase (CCA-adding enzyme)